VSTGGFIQPPHTHPTESSGSEVQPQQKSNSSSSSSSSSSSNSSSMHYGSSSIYSSSANHQEVVVEGAASGKGTVSAVVPYTAMGVGIQGVAAAHATSISKNEEEDDAAAALQLHPHMFRHLLDCSEDLCDDDAGWEVFDDGTGMSSLRGQVEENEEEEDHFSDSIC